MKKSKHLQEFVPDKFYYQSQLDVLSRIGWSHRSFDRLLSFAMWWDKFQPSEVLGAAVKRLDKSDSHKWGQFFYWDGQLNATKTLHLTADGRQLLLWLVKPYGDRYVKVIDMGRNLSVQFREKLIRGTAKGMIIKAKTGTPIFFLHEDELKPQEDQQPVAVQRISIHEDICCASPSRLLEILEPFKAPFLKDCVKLYQREKFVPYGIALNVKKFLHANAVI